LLWPGVALTDGVLGHFNRLLRRWPGGAGSFHDGAFGSFQKLLLPFCRGTCTVSGLVACLGLSAGRSGGSFLASRGDAVGRCLCSSVHEEKRRCGGASDGGRCNLSTRSSGIADGVAFVISEEFFQHAQVKNILEKVISILDFGCCEVE
jgi:hypothetical protein